MLLFPAIDLQRGACVRLERGDFTKVTVYERDPCLQARRFAQSGCRWLHVVDLDGAAKGRSVNGEAVRALLEGGGLKLQLGGGVRSLEDAAYWLESGISRLVLGTLAAREPATLREACRRFPGRIAVAVDSRNGRVAVEGWRVECRLDAVDFARSVEDSGAAALIHTDIGRDGMLKGPNLPALAAVAEAVSLKVVASGGVAGMEDLRRLKALALPNLEGVIAGRALYEGRLDAARAVAFLAA